MAPAFRGAFATLSLVPRITATWRHAALLPPLVTARTRANCRRAGKCVAPALFGGTYVDRGVANRRTCESGAMWRSCSVWRSAATGLASSATTADGSESDGGQTRRDARLWAVVACVRKRSMHWSCGAAVRAVPARRTLSVALCGARREAVARSFEASFLSLDQCTGLL